MGRALIGAIDGQTCVPAAGPQQNSSKLILSALLLGVAGSASAHDFLAFGDLTQTDVRNGESELVPLGSFFYSHDGERLRVLGEYVYASTEKELERLQLGLRWSPQTTLWLGRHHTPLGYINSEFHHGSFLETSITRAAIWRYEDESGVLPTHVSGLLLEHSIERGETSSLFLLSAGAGPSLTSRGLEPVDLLDPEFTGSSALSARYLYSPDGLRETVYGVYAGWFDIPVINRQSELELGLLGAFASWQRTPWQLSADALIIATDDETGNNNTYNTSVQLEREFEHGLTAFARGEASWHAKGLIFDRSPAFNDRELSAGLRYDFTPQTCGKLQLSRGREVSGHWNTTLLAQLCVMLSP